MAELSADGFKILSDDDFAYNDSKGWRHLPITDADDVLLAMARFGSTDFESDAAKQKARGKILKAGDRFNLTPISSSDGNVLTSFLTRFFTTG